MSIKKKIKNERKNIFVTIICIIIAIISGILTNDFIIGGIMLASGLLNGYFASIGKRYNYLFGFINYILMGYMALKNNLYGIFFCYILLFAPLQIKGFITWNNNLDKNNNVKIRQFNFKNACIIISSCIIGSFILGYFLNLIPGQQLPFMDATSNCINLCGTILMILRFKESWWLWLINNIIDVIIWMIAVTNNGEGSIMVLLTCIGFLLINIYGIIKWNIKSRRKS